jgi:phage portal protein BeeE
MGWLDAFRGRVRETPVPDPIATRHTFSYGGLLGHDLTASPWLVNVSEQTSLALDVVQDCVRVISDAVSGTDVGQWNGTLRIDPPSAFTLRPDPDITRRDFLWQFAANLALYQSVYLEEATFAGQVVGVRLHCIESVIHIGPDYYVAGTRITNRMRLVRMSVWPTLDPETGATIRLAQEVFAGAMAANAYQSDYWQQGGTPVVFIGTDQELTTDQATNIGDAYVAQRTTSPGRPPVFGKGAKPFSLGADLAITGTSESGDKLRQSVARYFKMVPDLVNVPSAAGALQYQTDEQIMLRFVRITVQPYCDVIGEALSAYLPGDYLLGDRIVLDPRGLLMADQFTRFQAWESALRAGWIKKSEVREREGLRPEAGIDDVVEAPANVGA